MSEVLDFTPPRRPSRNAHRLAASPMPLQVRGLSLELEGKRLLDQVDLTLLDNGITVILGPNGAGKTLLLKCLHGLCQPTSGTVLWHVDGLERPPVLEVRKAQALVQQKPVLLRRSVLANLKFAAKLRYSPIPQGLLENALALARLDHLASHAARTLSGGEQQRLALARALILKPKVLFLDEPAANLDPASTVLIEEAIRAAQSAGTKIVLITHGLSQARRLADNIVFLHRGRILEHSPADKFFSEPATVEAEAYVRGEIVL
ncbi:ATP-binding cassette domain-containing protein [Roseibium sp. CAU 1637]|uniref:ATP-binding cassette domain-containing protein n=1 Tax=Roseibium limicola TaxID=2816037 RepID=A0A939EM24_9HYPH|nr:ATP-binding cassette domain-containing protein [Roseibium limicola]MBO0344655.1 ATP-binding cassette domain-containing protein [Roseibium limicola]